MFITSWRNQPQHKDETIACMDCGATTPRLTWNTRRCPACQYPHKLKHQRIWARRQRARKVAK